MKKRLLLVALSAATLIGWAMPSQAQYYSSYTYNNNAYLNYAIASQKATATRNRARKAKKKHHKRRTTRAKRHSRR